MAQSPRPKVDSILPISEKLNMVTANGLLAAIATDCLRQEQRGPGSSRYIASYDWTMLVKAVDEQIVLWSRIPTFSAEETESSGVCPQTTSRYSPMASLTPDSFSPPSLRYELENWCPWLLKQSVPESSCGKSRNHHL